MDSGTRVFPASQALRLIHVRSSPEYTERVKEMNTFIETIGMTETEHTNES